MARESYAAVRALCEAYNRGDELGVLAALDPEVEWVERNLTQDAADRTRHGRRLVARAVLASWSDRGGSDGESSATQVLVAGEHVVMHGCTRSIVDGRPLDLPFTHVFTVRDGRITRLVTYREPPILVHALAS